MLHGTAQNADGSSSTIPENTDGAPVISTLPVLTDGDNARSNAHTAEDVRTLEFREGSEVLTHYDWRANEPSESLDLEEEFVPLIAGKDILGRRYGGILTENETFCAEQLSGSIDYTQINDTSHRLFGFQTPGGDVAARRVVSARESEQLSSSELSRLSHDEASALRIFTSHEYLWFNKAAYGAPLPVSDEDETFEFGGQYVRHPSIQGYHTRETFERVTGKIDEAFAHSPGLQRILYRGVAAVNAPIVNSGRSFNEYVNENFSLGGEVKFDGYQSLTYSQKTALEYAERGSGQGSLVFEVRAASGLHVTAISAFQSEQEVLMPRGSRYVVVGVHKDTPYAGSDENVTVVQMVEITDGGQMRSRENCRSGFEPVQVTAVEAGALFDGDDEYL